MNWNRRLSCSITLAALLAGCATARPSQSPPTAPTDATGRSEGENQDPGPDLSPVAAPGEVVLIGRWQKPDETADVLLGWTNLPLDWRMLAEQAIPRISSGPGSAVLALDAPVDLVVTLPRAGAPPEPRFAVSLGLTSLEGAIELAEAAGEEVVPVSAHVYRVGNDESPTCMLAPAVGRAPARLVCGDGFADVEELLPYMTRGLPTEALGTTDVYVELRGEPIRKTYGATLGQAGQLGLPFLLREAAFDDPRLDRVVADVARALVAEGVSLLEDLDRVSLAIDVDAAAGHALTTLAMDFRSTRSWTATTVADVASRQISAPDLFWNLPGDVPGASFGAPGNPARFQEMRRSAEELMDAALAHFSVPESVRKQMRKLVERTYTTSAPHVAIQGASRPPPTSSATASGDMDAFDALRFDSLVRQLGWQIHGAEVPAREYIDYLDACLRLYRDPAITKLLKDRVPDFDVKSMPSLVGRPAGGGLPAGSRHYELTVATTAAAGTKPVASSLHLLVVPDGKRTWLAFGVDLPVLRAELARVLKPGARTLRERGGLEALGRERHASAGFVTLRSAFDATLAQYLSLGEVDVERTLSAMPQHGDTPMLTSLRVREGAGPRLEWSMVVPKAVVADLAAAVPSLIASSLFSADED